jgi:hypothetical protein
MTRWHGDTMTLLSFPIDTLDTVVTVILLEIRARIHSRTLSEEGGWNLWM